MEKTDIRGGKKARLVSPYINTTDKCLEMFYWITEEVSHYEHLYLNVIAITEEHTERSLKKVYDSTTDFQRLYLPLPEGTHRIGMVGRRRKRGVFSAAVSLDDVIIMHCDIFGKPKGQNILIKVKM